MGWILFRFHLKSNNKKTLIIRLYSYFEKYKHLRKKFTIEHFISEGEKRTTIYDIINRLESGKNAKHQSGGGWLAEVFNKQAKKSLRDNQVNQDNHVNQVIKSMGIQKYKKQKIPNISDQQKEVKRAKCATTKTAV